MILSENDVQRMWPKISIGHGPAACWTWLAGRTTAGYGVSSVGGEPKYCHRLFYETFIGQIRSGLEVDHLCRNRACCNPAHLEAVTHQENVRRGDSGRHWAERKACPHGHPYAEERVGGKRVCPVCKLEAKRRYVDRNRDLINQRRRDARARSRKCRS